MNRRTTSGEWDRRFMRLAHEAASWSKDPDEKVGAIVVSPDRRQLGSGYNGFPPGIADTDERLKDKAIKNELMCHAEANALDNADRSVVGWTLYVTKPPCTRCALRIISRRVARVVCPPMRGDSRWLQDQTAAQGYLLEAGVHVTHASG